MKGEDQKQISDYNLISTAYHESSHIICALYNCFQVYSANAATIESASDSNTHFYSYDEPITDEELKRTILIFEVQVMMSGLVGERIYYKDITGSDRFPKHLKNGSAYDIKSASKLIRSNNLAVPGNKTTLLKKQIQSDVENMLNTYWADVKIIAHLLYRKKRLTYEDLKYTLTRKSDNKEMWKEKFRKIKTIFDKNCPSEVIVKDLMLANTGV